MEKRVSDKPAVSKDQERKEERSEDRFQQDNEEIGIRVRAESGNNDTIEELFTLVDEYYCEGYFDTKSDAACGDENHEAELREAEKEKSGPRYIERGLSNFLRLDPKHDIWKEARESSQVMKAW